MNANRTHEQMTLDEADAAAVTAGMASLDEHIAALNARDELRLIATLHFSHGRWAAQVRSSFAA